MNCDWVKAHILLYAYDELGDADRFEVEQHLRRCGDCARAAEAEKQLRRTMDAVPRREPSPALVAECRTALSETLETLPAHSRWAPWRFWRILEFFGGLRPQWQASLAGLLLLVGFAGGWFWSAYRGGRFPLPGALEPAPDLSEAGIANIQSISARSDGRLEIALDTTRRRVLTGRPDDPPIQNLLLYALRHYYNSGIRLDSIELLKNRTQDNQIRTALITALRTDSNPGVRLKALEALKGFESDAEVKKAFTDVLLTDNNPGVRVGAIEQLASRRDSRAIPVLQRLAEGDPNAYIRMKSASTLLEWNVPAETY